MKQDLYRAHSIAANMLVSNFKLHLCYYIHFQPNTIGTIMYPLSTQLCDK